MKRYSKALGHCQKVTLKSLKKLEVVGLAGFIPSFVPRFILT